MGELQSMMGDRVELREKRLRVETECKALRDQLRACLPAHVEVAELEGEAILNTALALQENLADLAGIDRQLVILNRLIGK
jgi:hypothetical protein